MAVKIVPHPSRHHPGLAGLPLFRLIALIVAVGWLTAAGWTVLQSSTFGSPDEAANDFFIRQLAETGRYQFHSPLTAEQLAVFHPRSMGVVGQNLVPGSFLGLVQIGAMVNRLGGQSAYLLLTPVLALGALLALFALFRHFWTRWWSLLGVVLVAAHPVWWQFQTLPAFHNGSFVSLLVITGLFLKRQHARPSLVRALQVGITYGLAMYFRPIEILWTGPLISIVLLTQPRGWRWWLIVVAVAGSIQLPWLTANADLYKSPLASAYAPTIAVSETETPSSSGIMNFFVPPGGWSWHWLSSAWWYLFLLLPAWSAMALASMISYFRRKFSNPYKVIKLSLVSLFVIWLLVYYGSWNLYPQEPASRVGSLASYARYWLPLYVSMGAGVVIFVRRLWTRSRLLAAALVIGLLVSQLTMIIWHPGSGLLARSQRDRTAKVKRMMILSSTPENALIIAGQSDKYLLPDRLVAFRLPNNESEWALLRQIRIDRPIYVYVTPQQYRRQTVQADLQAVGMSIRQVTPVQDDQLWEITL